VFIIAVTALGGFVKGTVGFGAPMLMVALFGSVLPPQTALAALIVPTVVTNLWQALRDGPAAAAGSALLHWRFIAMVMVFIALSAQLVTVLPARVMLLALGLPVMGFALAQLAGWNPRIPPRHRRASELVIGGIAGMIGGISGVWGPPAVIYLNALDTPKDEHMRVQGVVYGISGLTLLLAHVNSGVLNMTTLPLSLALVVPAMAGLGLGFALQDRLDQVLFRRLTLIVLVVAGANLLRRALVA
jgi:uncharacterized membrane protein YfcA